MILFFDKKDQILGINIFLHTKQCKSCMTNFENCDCFMVMDSEIRKK